MSKSKSSSNHNDLEFMTVPQQDDEAAYAMTAGGASPGDLSADGAGGGGFGGALSTVMGSTIFRHSKHPMAALFHLLFKVHIDECLLYLSPWYTLIMFYLYLLLFAFPRH
jgi:hypothetical protein